MQPEIPTMPAWRKDLFGLGAIAQLAILVPIWILALVVGFWVDDKNESSYSVAVAGVIVGLVIFYVTWASAFVHVWRRRDLPSDSRRRWLWGLFLLNGLLLPVFWFRLVRPLPESQD